MTRLLFITCCDNGFFCLRRLVAAGHEIAAVVTIPPEVGARNMVSGYVDVAPWCVEQGIKVVSLDTYTLTKTAVDHLDFDMVVVNGWNRLIPGDIIAAAPLGGVGLHAGHPPIGLGRAPLVWNILLGHSDLEVYAFALTPNADDGDILALQTVEITPQDSVQTLYEKVMAAGAALIAGAIDKRITGQPGLKQSLEFARHYGKRTPADGLIDFSQPVDALYNFIRAQSAPYPGAFTYLDGQKWVIQKAIPYDRFSFRNHPRVPGKIVEALPSGLVVMTATSPLWIIDAESEGALMGSGSNMDHLIGRCFGPQTGTE